MSGIIQNSRAIVTGGAQGIGFQICRHLLNKGAKAVVFLDINESEGMNSMKKLNDEFGQGRSSFLLTNVADITQFEDDFKKAVQTLGGLDIMINNAGVINDAEWKMEIDLNVTGVVQGTLLAIEAMGKHKGGKGGTVINMGSMAAFLHDKYLPVYCATKAAVIEFTRCISLNYEETGVKVKAMCPGATDTFLITNQNHRYLSFLNQEESVKWLLNRPMQAPDVLAKEVIHIIEEAPNGAIWSKSANNPVATVNMPKYSDLITPL